MGGPLLRFRNQVVFTLLAVLQCIRIGAQDSRLPLSHAELGIQERVGRKQFSPAFDRNPVGEPLALADADLDEDGILDLIVAYRNENGGAIYVFRGDPLFRYPAAGQSALKSLNNSSAESPFSSRPEVRAVEVAPEFLEAGDFDGDGHSDVLFADRREAGLRLIRGRGSLALGEPETIELEGPVTALIAGEVNRRDGIPDLVVSIHTDRGAELLVFQSPMGVLHRPPLRYDLPGVVTSLVLDRLDRDSYFDIAAAAGDRLVWIAGIGDAGAHSDGTTPESRLKNYPLPFPVEAVTTGHFFGKKQNDLILLSPDDRLFSFKIRDSGEGFPVELHEVLSLDVEPGTEDLERSAKRGRGTRMIRTRVSGYLTDDLLVLRPGREAVSLTFPDRSDRGGRQPQITAYPLDNLEFPEGTVGIFATRLNGDAIDDLIVLSRSGETLSFFLSSPLAVFTVNSTGSGEDDDPGDGTCDDGSGKCTLVAAIEESNAQAGFDLIQFNISGSGTPVISVSSLPQATGVVSIDGTTQFSGFVEIVGDAIDLQGGNSSIRGIIAPGIHLTFAGNNLVEGNVLGSTFEPGILAGSSDGNTIGGTTAQARNIFTNSSSYGIWLSGSNDNLIQGNYIGVDETGGTAAPNQLGGIMVAASSGNTIGGTEPGAGNVISGHAATAGVTISVAFQDATPIPADDNLVQGNLIGLAADGTTGLGNAVGIMVLGTGTEENSIGGFSPGARNVISGNRVAELVPGLEAFGWGINLGTESGLTTVIGNYIGTDATGMQPIPNESYGIIITGSGSNLVERNRIAYNGADGILITESTPPEGPPIPAPGNQITANGIFDNEGLGINLFSPSDPPDGVTENDPASFLNNADFDDGPNALQNFPTVTLSEDGTEIAVRLESTPNRKFRIEFFTNTSCDPAGYGEGREFLNAVDFSDSTQTDGTGLLEFTAPFSISPGQIITATATDLDGNTSEFSPCSAPEGLQLSPYLVLGMGFCENSPREIKVTDLSDGSDVTNDPDIELEWITLNGLGLPNILVTQVVDQLKKNAPGVVELLADIDVVNGFVTFHSPGFNVLRAKRKSDGTESNYAFVIGGMKLLKTKSLEIAPQSLTSPATNNSLAEFITDEISESICRLEGGEKCDKLSVDAPMVLFSPGGNNQCGGDITKLGTVGRVVVKCVKFDLFGGLVEDVELMNALDNLGIGLQLVGSGVSLVEPYTGTGIRWLGIAVARGSPFAVSQLLKFQVSSRAAGSSATSTEDPFILVSNDIGLSPPFIKGVVQAKSSGFSAVQATFDLESDEFCPGTATTLMPVWVLPDLEKVDIRNPEGRVEDPLLLTVGRKRQATSVGVFNFVSGEIQFDPLGLGSEVEELGKLADRIIPGASNFLVELNKKKTLRLPSSPDPVDGFYQQGRWFFDAEVILRPTSLGINRLAVQIPIPNPPDLVSGYLNPNRWSMQPPPVATVSASGLLEGKILGDTVLDLEVCIPFLTKRQDSNEVKVTDGPSILVQKFEDQDASRSKDGLEKGVNDWLIQLERVDDGTKQSIKTSDIDLNEDGLIDPQTETGLAWFKNLDETSYRVKEEFRSIWTQTTPNPPVFNLDQNPSATAQFGNFRHMTIQGRKFEDLNGNGIDDGEPGLAGWQINVDLNADDVVDLTTVTDSGGNYLFDNVSPGDLSGEKVFTVEETEQAGWIKTWPKTPNEAPMHSGLTAVFNFGNFKTMQIGGTKFHDQNQDGIRQAGEPPLPGWVIEIDLHADGTVDDIRTTDAAGQFVFRDIGPGDPEKARQFSLRERPQAGFTPTLPAGGVYTVAIRSGLNRLDFDFGNSSSPFEPVRFCGTKFEDLDGDGVRDTEPGLEPGLANWTIRLSGPEGDWETLSGADGSYCFENIGPGSYEISEAVKDGWIVTVPSKNIHKVIAESGKDRSGLDFGNFKLALVTGMKFHDADSNSRFDSGESKLSGWTIYLDANDDGILNNPAGDGVCSGGALERCMVTAADGSYAFTGLEKGTYIIREVQQSGWRNTTDEFFAINVETSGQAFQKLDFGNTEIVTRQITGQVFFDRDSSGGRDPTEAAIPGWTVFLDQDDDGNLDGAETSVLTDAEGRYAFQEVSAGQQVVRTIPASGWRQTYPTGGIHRVDMPESGTVANIDFGFDLITPYELYIPFFRGDRDSFTGFAFSNYSDSQAYLEMTSFDPDGDYSSFPENPAGFRLGQQNQSARLGFEIFQVDPSFERIGWVRVVTDNPELASFFMFGGSKEPFLDGSIAFTKSFKTLYFSHILEGDGAFRGSAAETLISLANPGSSAIRVQFTLFVPASDIGISFQTRQNSLVGTVKTIPGNGVLAETVTELFGDLIRDFTPETLARAYLRAEVVEGGGAVGFQLVRTANGRTVFGLNAAPTTDSRLSFSAQLASSAAFFTELRLINVSGEDRNIRLSAVSEEGDLLAARVNLVLETEEAFGADVEEIFTFAGQDAVGSIRVEADGAGVIGAVVFGDPENLRFAAAMPLQTEALTRAVFSQVANISGYFTGLAFFNPGSRPAAVTVTVYKSDGLSSGETQFNLQTGERKSRLLAELIPATAGQDRGFILLRSTEPLIAQQFFGDSGLNLLSSVPPTLIETGSIEEPVVEVEESEPNDAVPDADRIEPGQIGLGTVNPAGDRDLWRFDGTEGDRILIEIEADSQGSILDSFIALFLNEDRDNDGFLDQIAQNDDADGDTLDSRIESTLPESNS